MYSIYTTPGFIIDSRPYGEADKILSIFTRDLGLVFATARGLRQGGSKLRYFAQDLSWGSFSLVRGREFWRLTSAAQDADRSGPAAEDEEATLLKAKLAVLLKRLLHGEEANAELFGCLASFLACLKDGSAVSSEERSALESLTVARMLHALGYMSGEGPLKGLMDPSASVSPELLSKAATKKEVLNRLINKALKESQL